MENEWGYLQLIVQRYVYFMITLLPKGLQTLGGAKGMG